MAAPAQIIPALFMVLTPLLLMANCLEHRDRDKNIRQPSGYLSTKQARYSNDTGLAASMSDTLKRDD
jgi:hypothetical protein